MKTRIGVCLTYLLALSLFCIPSMPARTSQDDNQREEWERDDSFGFPVWIARNVVDDDFDDAELARRLIDIFIESQNFTKEKVRKVITGLAAEFLVPHDLWIAAYDDRQVLQRDLDAVGMCSASGIEEPSLSERQWSRNRYAREVRSKQGYLYADYSRLDESEVLEFKPDPQQHHTWQFDLKNPDSVYTGNADKDLLAAAEKGDLSKVSALLETGADVNARDIYENTPLMAAAWKGQVYVVKLLLEKGADANLADDRGYTALISAATDGCLAVVETLLDAGADVNAHTLARSDGSTALMQAALHRHFKVVERLLERGASLEDKNVFGETALLNAAVTGSSEVVSYLIGKGAEVDVRDFENKTALMMADDDRETVRALLNAGADFKMRDNEGMTALMVAANEDDGAKAQALVDFGAGPDSIAACKAWMASPPVKERAQYNPGYKKEEGYEMLAEIYLRLGKKKKAVEASKRALKELGDQAHLRARLGFTYLKVGDRKAAMQQYQILKERAARATDEETKELYTGWAENLLEKLQMNN